MYTNSICQRHALRCAPQWFGSHCMTCNWGQLSTCQIEQPRQLTKNIMIRCLHMLVGLREIVQTVTIHHDDYT